VRIAIVVDASVLVAALIDGGDDGRWASEQLVGKHLAAPALLPVEVANILRRAVAAQSIPDAVASQAHADLMDLPIVLFPYAPFGLRVWELRSNVVCNDAWYIAIAEALEAPLVTLDVKLARASGPRCSFVTPRRARRT